MVKAISLILYVVAVQGLPLPTSQKFNQSLQLDSAGKYTIYWAYNATHITFEVHVQTTGYVGFGISPNGNMYPADVVIGWVKDGIAYLSDRHTTGHAPPIVDKSQDWFLLHGEENDHDTILTFVRKLDTCDSEDIAINDQTIRLIYSYHPDDPTSENSLPYHGAERRGTKSVSLLSTSLPSALLPNDDVKILEFRTRNYVVPDKDTTYLCTGFQIPDLGGKHHMIEYEPIYTPGHDVILHHLVILKCEGRHPDLDMQTAECFWDWPKDWPSCPEVFAAWGTGGGPYYFPDNAGYALGDDDDSGFYVMQTHYNNPAHKSGMIDSSGLRVKLTSQLRQHDVTGMSMAHIVSNLQVIPPHEHEFISRGYCSPQCTSGALGQTPAQEIHIIAAFQHAHTLGAGVTTRHFRNGTEIEPLMDDPNYDFYFQEMRPLKEERTIKPGDSFIVECTYNSMGRSEVSFGGLSTREEMCITFLYVYPRTSLRACSSVPVFDTYNVTGKALHKMFETMDWHDPNIKADFKQKLEDSKYSHHCVRRVNGTTTVDKYEYVERNVPFNRAQFANRQCPAISH